MAGFVGNNKRVDGQVEQRDGDFVLLRSAQGLVLWAQRQGTLDKGQTASFFLRPEAIEIGRNADELPRGLPSWSARVQSVLFDGGNSAVQVVEMGSQVTLQIALPLTGRLADLQVGETVFFTYQPSQAWCFAGGA